MSELTLASWNVHWGRGMKLLRFPPFDLVAGCRLLDADVLVLQECWAPDDGPSQQDEVAAALGYDVRSVALGRAVAGDHPKVVDRADPERRRGDGDWSLAVLSRLPVAGSEVTWLPQRRTDPVRRAVLHVEVEVGGRRLVVHGAHLPHLQMGSPLLTRPLRACLGPVDRASVLVGDMNMWGWCIAAMAPPGWRREGRGRTFPAPFPHSRIDHLVHTPPVEVLGSEVVRHTGSDHRPIRARLRVAA